MEYKYPTDVMRLLARVIGQNIVRVRRAALVSDYNDLPQNTRDEESDGETEFVFGNGDVLHLTSHTESMSVQIAGELLPEDNRYSKIVDVTQNSFWKERVERKVTGIDVLVSDSATNSNRQEFAIGFHFAGAPSCYVEYISDEDHVDQIRVIDFEPGGYWKRVSVK